VVMEQALATARASENGLAHAQALSVLIPSLPEAAIPAALGEAQELGNDAYLALAPLVPRLPVEARQGAIAQVLEAVQRNDRLVVIELPEDFIDVLGPIAASLSDAQLRTALALTEAISRGHASLKADALTILAPRLRGSTLDQALSIAQGLSDRLSRVRALASLAPSLAERKRTAILSDAHRTARQLDGKERVRAAVVLAPLLAERRKILSQALEATLMIDEDDRRADALGLLLPSLVGPERLSAFDRMLRSCLGVRVVKTVGATVFRDSIDRAFLLERIAAAAGVVQAIGGEHAVEATARAVRDATSEWP
jgi:hypothetical protein